MSKSLRYLLIASFLSFGFAARSSPRGACEARLADHVSFARYAERIATLRTELAGRSAYGRAYSLDEAVALLTTFLDDDQADVVVRDAWARLSRLAVVLKASPGPALKYRSRWVDWSVRRRATIVWSTAVVGDRAQLEKLVESTIDLLTEAAFVPVRRHSVYLASPATFVGRNVAVLREKLMLKLLVLGEGAAAPAPSAWGHLGAGALTAVKALLPLQFTVIRSLRLDRDHVAAFHAGGPAGLYRHLKRRSGFALALKYWVVHVTNFKVALAVAYASLMAPSAVEAWTYFSKLQTFTAADDAQGALAHRLYDALRAPPAQVFTDVRAMLDRLTPEERGVIERALRP